MTPLVSIIVPTRNSATTLANCLRSIQKQSYNNIEIIIVDNNSTDKTPEIARKYTEQVFNKGPERSAQRNFGTKQSKGDYLLFIDSDMKLSSDVVQSCVNKIKTNPGIKALIIPEESYGEGFWAKCKKLERSFYVGVNWMEAARFFARDVFIKFNGYDEANTGTEDYDLPQRILRQFGQESITCVNAYIYHNEGRVHLLDCCKKKFYYARELNRYFSVEANKVNYKKQSSLTKRFQLFLSNPQKLMKFPIIGLGMLFMKTCEFAAGGLGFSVQYLFPISKSKLNR